MQRMGGLPLDGRSLVPLINNDEWPARTLFVQDQRGKVSPVKWFKTAVMTDRWRLVNNKVLNDIEKDQAQTVNEIGKFFHVVRKLRAEYDHWWTDISHTDHEIGKHIIVGSDHENPCKLTAHDNFAYLWNHDQVLEGLTTKNCWLIEVDRYGEYEFILRRYPEEAAAPIRGTIPVPQDLRDFNYYHHEHQYQYAMKHTRSRELPIESACFKIGNLKSRKDVPHKAAKNLLDFDTNKKGEVTGIRFRTMLNRGPARFEAWFENRLRLFLTNAYYVYVKRL
jgi:hypothetical protein